MGIERIIDCLNRDYGIANTNLTAFPGGADRNASVYKAQGQTAYFVKLKHGHHDDLSATLLTLLQDAGIQQIIPPVKTIHHQPFQLLHDFTLIVYPFIKGQDGFNRNLTHNQWITLGKVLRQVHAFQVPASVKERIRREAYSPVWRTAVRSLYAQIDAGLNGDRVMIKYLKEHLELILHLVDRAEQLSQKIRTLTPEFVLCHSDIHGGNVLIEENGAIYIVDWDEPIMAPKERDLMFIGGGVANVWNLHHEEDLFYQGYGVTEINREIMAYYRFERIVVDIAEFAMELIPDSSKDKSEMYRQFTGMFKKRGVVDIALETDPGA